MCYGYRFIPVSPLITRLTPRIHEGAADNLPDAAAELTAREILSLAQEAGEGELLVTLVSGGGSALLPCPPLGVTLQEKRKVCGRGEGGEVD